MKNKKWWWALALAAGAFTINSPDMFAQQQETLVETGDDAVGNGSFAGIGPAILNDRGDVSFEAFMTGTNQGSADNAGIFTQFRGGALQEQVREGDLAPNEGVFFRSSLLGLNNSGQSLFRSEHTATTAATGIYRGNANGSRTELARELDSLDNGGSLGSLFSTDCAFNELGQTSLQNQLANSGDDAIFRLGENSITEIARQGDNAPGTANSFTRFFRPIALNNRGEVAFFGGTETSNSLYIANNTSITLIAESGTQTPTGNGTFGTFTNDVALNDSGQIAFATFADATANGELDDLVLLRRSGNSLVEVMRAGNAAPKGGVFDGTGGFSFDALRIQMNQSGQIAFNSNLRQTAGGTSDDTGIFRSSAFGSSLVQIAREGQAIDTGEGRLGGLRDTRIALNDLGNVAFSASLTDATSNRGIFIGDGTDLLTVAQTGQTIDGKEIIDTVFRGGESVASGLNNKGQVAYLAVFDDGSQALQLWTPDLHWRRTFSSDWDVADRWTLGITPGEIYNTFIDSDASVTVQGPSSDTTVKSLTIGGGNGIATFQMEDGATLTSLGGTRIESTGVLTGDGTLAGDVTNLGTIDAQNVRVAGLVLNAGIISGSGRIHSSNLINNAQGEIRSGQGDVLNFRGPSLSNFGRIEVIGGEFSAEASVFNASGTGLIVGRDATMRFDNGVQNQGSIGISFGTSDVFGNINNDGGTINVSGGANVTFYDDVRQNGTLEVVSVGNTSSTAVFFGEFGGNGGFTGGGDVYALGDLRPGNSPASVLMDGNLFLGASTNSLFELGGVEFGQFDQLIVTGDLNLAGDFTVDLIDDFNLELNQHFLIADVDGIQSGQFLGFAEGSTVANFGGIDLFISYQGGDGNDVYLFSAVPEPGSASILLMGAFGLLIRRRRFSDSPRCLFS